MRLSHHLAAALAAPFLFTVVSLPLPARSAPIAAKEADTPSAEPIEQIVVVAHKTERSIRDVAANVTVLTRAELKGELADSMMEVFRYTPGIDSEGAGTRFGTEGINIRGIGGNRVALLVDGVPLADQFDVGSFSNAARDFVSAGLVDQVEILHGPASALYGSAAIGGVVALTTPDPGDITGTRSRGGELSTAWRDADGSAQGTAMLGLAGGSAGMLLGGSWRDGRELDSAAARGAADRKRYERQSALFKVVADDVRGGTWRASLYHQQSASRTELRSMLGSGRFRSTTRLAGDDQTALDLLNVSYEFGAPGEWVDTGVLRAYYELAEADQATLDERANASRPVSIDRDFHFEQRIRGIELNLQKEVRAGTRQHRLGAGIEYRDRQTEEYRDGLERDLSNGARTSVILGESFPLRDFPISITSEIGAYVEDSVSFGKLTVIAAIRADRFELRPQDDPLYAEDYPFAEPIALSESDISPKLGLIYQLSPSTDVFLQYAHGFRAPPYEDANIGLEIPAFNYRAIPNPELRSERSDGLDLGLRWRGTSSTLSVAVFRTRYDDFIESKVRLGTDPVSGRVLFQSQNIDATEIEGLEAGWEIRLPRPLAALTFDGALYLARGENLENGEALNSVGPAQAVLGLGWSSADGRTSLKLRATLTETWSERDESGGDLFEPPGTTVFDLYASRRLSRRVTAQAGILNLTDRSYWHWSDVRGLAPDDPILPVLAQAGTSFTVGLNMNW